LELREGDGYLDREKTGFVHGGLGAAHGAVDPHPALEDRHRLLEFRCHGDTFLIALPIVLTAGLIDTGDHLAEDRAVVDIAAPATGRALCQNLPVLFGRAR